MWINKSTVCLTRNSDKRRNFLSNCDDREKWVDIDSKWFFLELQETSNFLLNNSIS